MSLLAKDQQSQWSEIQKSPEQLLNTEPLKLKLDENSLIAANNNLFLPAPNNERSSYCSSITSEKFYDAESIILSSDDEYYGDNENVVYSDDSYISTTTDEEKVVNMVKR